MYKTNDFLKIILMSLMSLIFMSCSITPLEEVYSIPWNGFTSTRPPQVDGVYIITDGEHLAWLALITIFEAHVRFDANIDMNNKNFAGIKHFKGTMDGNGYSIKNLKMDYPRIAKFGLIHHLTGDSSEIKNLTIKNGVIKGNNKVGSFVGDSEGTVTITGLTNKASVESIAHNAGGIIAYISGAARINNTQNFGAIIGGDGTGGIIGEANGDNAVKITIDNVQNLGEVIGGSSGGMIGSTAKNVEIDNAQNSGDIISSAGSSGGMIGDVIITPLVTPTITINNAENSGNIISGDYAGGMIGFVDTGVVPVIKNTENSGTLEGTQGSKDLVGNK